MISYDMTDAEIQQELDDAISQLATARPANGPLARAVDQYIRDLFHEMALRRSMRLASERHVKWYAKAGSAA